MLEKFNITLTNYNNLNHSVFTDEPKAANPIRRLAAENMNEQGSNIQPTLFSKSLTPSNLLVIRTILNIYCFSNHCQERERNHSPTIPIKARTLQPEVN